jgi:adenosylhomocysteine nucleosidase
MKLALFSAFPQELTYIIKSLRAERIRSTRFIIHSAHVASREIIIVQSGMGVDISEAAWKYVFEEYRPDYVISAGFCGAFYEGAVIGDLIVAARVLLYPDIAEACPAHMRQNFLVEIPAAREVIENMTHAVTVREGSLLTFGRWTRKSEVGKELLQGLSFPICDMETFPLARLSLKEGLPFIALRAVTDRAHEEIPPELFGVTGANGNFSLLRALRIILSNPAVIPSCIRMEKNARLASQKLCRAIEELVSII